MALSWHLMTLNLWQYSNDHDFLNSSVYDPAAYSVNRANPIGLGNRNKQRQSSWKVIQFIKCLQVCNSISMYNMCKIMSNFSNLSGKAKYTASVEIQGGKKYSRFLS